MHTSPQRCEYTQLPDRSLVQVRVRPFVLAIMAGLAVAAVTATPAFGQETSTSRQPEAVAQTARPEAVRSTTAQAESPEGQSKQAAPTQPQTLKAIQVTGSLIRSPNQVSASPITTVDMADLKQGTGSVDVTDLLNQLPQLNATSSRFMATRGSNGIESVNLRGLGSNRNLVLLDGRRLPPADSSGNVDINLIPEAAVDSVDVITGGASAVYGSDAMSGVVNFHTIPYFDGIKGDVQYGNSTKGDFAQQSASVALGSGFGDGKGHVLLALGYTDSQELKGSQRRFFDLTIPSSYLGTGLIVQSATNLPDQNTVNGLFASYGAATPVSNTLDLGFNDDGTLFTQTGAENYKGPNGTDDFAIIGGNVRMPVGPQYILANPVKRKQIFSKFDYEFSPNFTMYGQVMHVESHSKTAFGLSLTQFAVPTVPVTNPFIPADLQTLLASRPDPTAPFTLKARYVGVPLLTYDDSHTTSQFLAGVRGDLFGDWTYDVYVSHSTTDHPQQIFNAVLYSRVQTLLDAPDGGNSICTDGFNPFGLVNSTNISQDCLNYMTTTAHSQDHLTQNIVQATAQGSLFQLPAGPVKMAVQADTRRDSYQYTPDTSLAAQDIEAITASAPTEGGTKVKEVATEFQVPLLSDVPFAQSLILDAAYRYSKYDLSGGVDAYEADLKWRPVESLLLRAGYQRAVRAPNIGELFAAAQGVQVGLGTPPSSVGDPCDIRSPARVGANAAKVVQLCEEQGIPAALIDTYIFPTTAVAGLQSGNTNLKPESATTWNAGFQWTSTSDSELLRSMSASVDYWNIDIKNVISVVPGTTSLSKCFNLDGANPTYSLDNTFCQLLHRNADGLLVMVDTPFLNQGSLKTDGVDLQFNWSPSLSSLGMHASGAMFLASHVSYTRSYKIQTLVGAPEQDFINTIAVGDSHPRWKALTTVGFMNQDFTVGLRWHYLGAMQDVSSVTNPTNPSPGTSTYQTYDLFATYFVNNQLELRMGVNDLTDKGAIPVSTSQYNSDAALFNPVGRTYYVGLHFSM